MSLVEELYSLASKHGLIVKPCPMPLRPEQYCVMGGNRSLYLFKNETKMFQVVGYDLSPITVTTALEVVHMTSVFVVPQKQRSCRQLDMSNKDIQTAPSETLGSLRQRVYTKSMGLCGYCSREFTEDNHFTVDHKVPLSRGGSKQEHNLVAACKECNHKKDNYLLSELPPNWFLKDFMSRRKFNESSLHYNLEVPMAES